jgi:hypothetical protein
MTQLATIRAVILAKMQSVPGMGQIHNRERYAKEEKAFRDLYTAEFNVDGELVTQVRGWWFRRSSTAERSLGVGRNMEINTWTIRGYMAFSDEASSEHTFDALIEALRDAFRADPTLGGVCEQSPLRDANNLDGLQVQDVGPVMLGGVLCHSAALTYTTWSYL